MNICKTLFFYTFTQAAKGYFLTSLCVLCIPLPLFLTGWAALSSLSGDRVVNVWCRSIPRSKRLVDSPDHLIKQQIFSELLMRLIAWPYRWNQIAQHILHHVTKDLWHGSLASHCQPMWDKNRPVPHRNNHDHVMTKVIWKSSLTFLTRAEFIKTCGRRRLFWRLKKFPFQKKAIWSRWMMEKTGEPRAFDCSKLLKETKWTVNAYGLTAPDKSNHKVPLFWPLSTNDWGLELLYYICQLPFVGTYHPMWYSRDFVS